MAEPGMRRWKQQPMVRRQPRYSLENAVRDAENKADKSDDEDAFDDEPVKKVDSASSSSASARNNAPAPTPSVVKGFIPHSAGTIQSNSSPKDHHQNGIAHTSVAASAASSSTLATPSTPASSFSSSPASFQTPSSEQTRIAPGQVVTGAATKIDKLLQDQSTFHNQIRDLQRTLDSVKVLSEENTRRLAKVEDVRPISMDQLHKATVALEGVPKTQEEVLDRTRDQATLIQNLTKLVESQQSSINELRESLDLSLAVLRNEIKAQTQHHTDLELELLKREQSSYASLNRMIVGQAVLWLFVLVVFVGWLQATPYR
eukprot:TRINITY_DN1925_c0_g1_i2.p2 TRINITY_DN1925_c0_g1~~TRINITY_DN1925_c0_g1_i2.p2  ORF type:complete len:328 (-),score=63.73 TRINITY_DN1925_c0_g1_i2:2190-3137(-)